jgi:hypothetical protein
VRLSLSIGALALATSVWAVGGDTSPARTPVPKVTEARPGTQCIAPPQKMRREHMSMLRHQRDDTVRGGIRGAQASLKGCVDCHAGAATRSVSRSAGDFCVSCHEYAAVKIDCFECHAGSPPSGAHGTSTPLAGARP